MLYWQIFFTFFKLGIFTLGGGTAMIPLMESIMVDKKGWLSRDEVLDCISISQGLPGVIAVNMATYIGYKKKGFTGALAATLGVLLPSYIVIILVITVLKPYIHNSYVRGAFRGMLPVIVGLILATAVKLWKSSIKTILQGCALVLTIFVVIFLKVNPVWIIIAALIYGFALGIWTQRELRKKVDDDKAEVNHE